MSDNEFRVWKIPPLIDRSTNPDPTFEHIAPLLHQIHREPAEHSGSLIVPQIGWKHAMLSKMHFDILYRQNNGATAISHHILHPWVDEGSPIVNFVGQTLSITPSYRATAYVKSAWMSPTEAVYFWAENYKIVAALSTLASSNEIPNQCSVGILWKNAGRKPDAEMCPFSGRVCLLNRPRSDESGSVQIMDYV
jgi:hypothetical protein